MAVTTTYKWNVYNVTTYYPEESGTTSDWSSYSAGTSYSGYTSYSFDNENGTFSLSGWYDGEGGTYYDGSGSSITATEVEFMYIAGTEEVYYRCRTTSISVGTPSYGQGDYSHQTQSTNRNAYPSGVSGSYYYEYIGYVTTTDAAYSYVKTNCTDGNNGTITVSTSGGSGTQYVKLVRGATTISDWSTTKQFTGLSAGNYTVYGKDAQATNTEYTQAISIAAAATFTSAKTNCTAYATANGTITASGTGGSGTYQYALYLGASLIRDWATSGSFTALAAGTYSLRCRDTSASSVVTTISVIVYAPPSFSYSKTDNTNPTTPNGSITASAVGGSGSYMYKLNSGALQSSGVFTGLAAGTYTLLCVEQGGLATQQSFSVTVALNATYKTAVGNTIIRGIAIGNTAVISIAIGNTIIYSAE